jgi:general secretion pathway protein C
MTYNVISVICQNLSRPIVPRLACLSVSILILWQLVSGIMTVSEINKSQHQNIPVVVPVPINNALSNAGLNALFFGKYMPPMTNVADVKKSLLTYKVVGIMLAARDEDSEVIIDTLSGGDQIYRVGDELPWGSVIKHITNDGIFVERNGELESLTFPKNELIFEPPPKPM